MLFYSLNFKISAFENGTVRNKLKGACFVHNEVTESFRGLVDLFYGEEINCRSLKRKT